MDFLNDRLLTNNIWKLKEASGLNIGTQNLKDDTSTLCFTQATNVKVKLLCRFQQMPPSDT